TVQRRFVGSGQIPAQRRRRLWPVPKLSSIIAMVNGRARGRGGGIQGQMAKYAGTGPSATEHFGFGVAPAAGRAGQSPHFRQRLSSWSEPPIHQLTCENHNHRRSPAISSRSVEKFVA